MSSNMQFSLYTEEKSDSNALSAMDFLRMHGRGASRATFVIRTNEKTTITLMNNEEIAIFPGDYVLLNSFLPGVVNILRRSEARVWVWQREVEFCQIFSMKPSSCLPVEWDLVF